MLGPLIRQSNNGLCYTRFMKELQSWEVNETRYPYVPSVSRKLRSKSEVIDEVLKPCSRFNSAAPWDDKMDALISKTLASLDPYSSESLLFSQGTPLNWQLLVDFLHEHGITRSKAFVYRHIETDLPRRISVDLLGADLTGKTDGRIVNPFGFGRSATVEESMSKAVGELLERYFLSIYRDKSFVSDSYTNLKNKGRNALDPDTLNGFLPWQREILPSTVHREADTLKWVSGEDITSGKKILMPAQLIFWNYLFDKQGSERMLMEPNTSGCAGHFSTDEVTLASLLELIQRDGFLIYWLNSISPNILDVSTLTDPDCIELLQEMRRYRLDFYFLNTKTDIGVPSCVCVVIDRSGDEPVLALGGGAGFTEHEIIFQSAGEALSVLTIARSGSHTISEPYVPFTDGRISRDQRLVMWRGQKMLERFKFFLSGKSETIQSFLGERMSPVSPQERLTDVLEQLKRLGSGYECYRYEVKDTILTTLGYHVGRVIVPKLVGLYLTESIATLDAERLRTVPATLGFTAAEKYNPWPHPFP